MAAVMQLGDALFTNLTHTLTGKSHLCANFLQTTFLTSDTKTLTNDLQLTIF